MQIAKCGERDEDPRPAWLPGIGAQVPIMRMTAQQGGV